MFGGTAVAVGLAYALSLVSTWLMNVTAYPGFNDFAPWARDVATTMGGAAGIAYALYARWRPYGFLGKGTLAVALTLLLLGPLSMLCAVAWNNPALALAGSCARSMSTPFVTVYLIFSLMAPEKRQRAGVLVTAYGVYYVAVWPLESLLSLGAPWVVPVLEALFVLLPLVAAGLLYTRAVPALREVGSLGTQAELSPTNPAPFLLLNHRLYVVAALFQAGMGYATTFASSQSYPQPLLPAVGLVAMLAACMLLSRDSKPIDGLYTLAFGCALAGFLLIPGTVEGLGPVVTLTCGSLCRAGETLFPLVLMVGGVGSFGFELGALTGHGVNCLTASYPELVFMVGVVVVLGFAMFNFVLARTFSFDATVAGVEPVQPVRELSEEAAGARDYDAVCARLAAATWPTSWRSSRFRATPSSRTWPGSTASSTCTRTRS